MQQRLESRDVASFDHHDLGAAAACDLLLGVRHQCRTKHELHASCRSCTVDDRGGDALERVLDRLDDKRQHCAGSTPAGTQGRVGGESMQYHHAFAARVKLEEWPLLCQGTCIGRVGLANELRGELHDGDVMLMIVKPLVCLLTIMRVQTLSFQSNIHTYLSFSGN